MTLEHKTRSIIKWAALAVVTAAALYLTLLMYARGNPVLGSVVLAGFAVTAYVYTGARTHSYRYLFPGLAGMAIFVVFPLLFTVWLGFTNYSSEHILTFERATDVFLSKTYELGDERMAIELHADGPGHRLVLRPEAADQEPEAGADDQPDDGDDGSIFGDDDEGSIFDDDADAGPADDDEGSIFDDDADAGPAGRDAGTADAGGVPADAAVAPVPDAGAGGAEPRPAREPVVPVVYVTERLLFEPGRELTVPAMPLQESGFVPGEPLPLRELIARQDVLDKLSVRLPGGAVLVKSTLRSFAAEAPLYQRNPDNTLLNRQTGELLTPNVATGFYQTASGEPVTPGFRVHVGFAHYFRLVTDAGIRAPFLQIFFWTVLFAGFTVLFTLIVGVLLAELLDWEGLRFRQAYRVMLFLPYAVPVFLSILVFKGLFNENSGEINLILGSLFGHKLRWFTDELLAKVMILIVNTWLGYPYIMLLWLGLRQSIPGDLYEASALAGAGPFTNFFKITWPLIRRPLLPLLVASFAFNFNNFTLIQLLTAGRPDILGTLEPAGTNDLLVTFTYRIAFQSTGQKYGLAAAISTVIFIMVAILSLINLRLTKASRGDDFR